MNTNIQGLDRIIEALNQKIDALDSYHKNLEIKGGDGVLVSKLSGNKYVINNIDNTKTPDIVYPWDVKFEKNEDGETYYLSTNGGQINGTLPDNYDDFGSIGEDDTTLQYAVLVCETDLNGIVTATLEIRDELPVDGLQYTKNEIPTSFELLIAVLIGRFVKHQIYRGNLTARPEIAYTYENPDNYTNLDYYWVWAMHENK